MALGVVSEATPIGLQLVEKNGVRRLHSARGYPLFDGGWRFDIDIHSQYGYSGCMSATLANSPFGTHVHILRVAGERGYRRRLMELGFLEGAVVRVLGSAPMGDPLDVEVRGCRFSLRKAEAELISVCPVAIEHEPLAAK